jgi:hypothetical protein
MNEDYLTKLYKMVRAGMEWIDKHPDANISFEFISCSTMVSGYIIPQSDGANSLLKAIRDSEEEEEEDACRAIHMESLAVHLIIGELKGYFKKEEQP